MSMVRLKVDLPQASEMPLAPAPSLPEPAFVERGGLDVVAPRSPKPTRREVSLDEEVGLSGVLAQVPGALFARKLCDFLINLEADDPRSARRLVASWMAIRDRRKKAGSSILKEKSFKSKSKKERFHEENIYG
jgi:hypothetical protein